jgi:DNA-binding transcriptional regulator WhiA
MSFAAQARSEIAHAPLDQVCCARAELAAALLASSGISIHGKGIYRLSLSSSEATIVRRYFSLAKRFFGVTC